MNTVTNDTERLYLNYIEVNKDFLKELHRIYYTKYRGYLEGYRLSDYMITASVKANDITGYNDYEGFLDGYLLQLSNDIEEAVGIYNAYYDCFIENMEDDIKRIQKRFNKDDEEIYIAYEIKVLFQFYIGFLNEKILSYYIDGCDGYNVVGRSVEGKNYIDDNYAIDIEVVSDTGAIMAIQSKSYTYLSVSDDKKQIHINKHISYTNAYDNSKTYYTLHKDCKPCYYMKDNESCYLIESKEILKLERNEIHVGTYEAMMNQMKGMI